MDNERQQFGVTKKSYAPKVSYPVLRVWLNELNKKILILKKANKEKKQRHKYL